MFFFNDSATTEVYTLSLHDALPIFAGRRRVRREDDLPDGRLGTGHARVERLDPQVLRLHAVDGRQRAAQDVVAAARSEAHTSELQSRQYLVCRLLLGKKNTIPRYVS